MRRRAAVREDEALEPAPIEREELAWGHLVGHAHRVDAERHLVAGDCAAVDLVEQGAADVADVQRPLEQQGAARGRQHRAELGFGLGDGTGRRELALPDGPRDGAAELGVARHRPVRPQHVGFDTFAAPVQPLVVPAEQPAERPFDSLNLGVGIGDAGARDRVRERQAANRHRAADSDAAHDRDPRRHRGARVSQHRRERHRPDGCRRRGDHVIDSGERAVDEDTQRLDRPRGIPARRNHEASIAVPDVEADDAEDTLRVRGAAGALVGQRHVGSEPARDVLERAGRTGVHPVRQRAGEFVVERHGSVRQRLRLVLPGGSRPSGCSHESPAPRLDHKSAPDDSAPRGSMRQ